MQNLTILASTVADILFGASKFKVGHVTLTTPLLKVICHPYSGIAYTNAKFNHYSFSRSGDMVGAHQNLNGLRDLNISLSGIVYLLRSTYLLNLK